VGVERKGFDPDRTKDYLGAEVDGHQTVEDPGFD